MTLPKSRRKTHRSRVSEMLANDDTVWLSGASAVGRVVVHSTISRQCGAGVNGRELDSSWRLQQLSHDIRHEIATISLLASLLHSAPDVGPDSRQRARQILGEARWLEQLQRAYEQTLSDPEDSLSADVKAIRLDLFADEVVNAVMMSASTELRYRCQETWARVDKLAFWRVLRNMISNAVRAAGPHGQVDVSVETTAGKSSVRVEDDGPGFGASPPGLGAYGLDIVQQFAIGWGGELEIGQSRLGGCSVRLQLPAAAPPPSSTTPGDDDASPGL